MAAANQPANQPAHQAANVRYEVCGAFPVLEVEPGGSVDHADLEAAGANISALLQSGLIKPAEQKVDQAGKASAGAAGTKGA